MGDKIGKDVIGKKKGAKLPEKNPEQSEQEFLEYYRKQMQKRQKKPEEEELQKKAVPGETVEPTAEQIQKAYAKLDAEEKQAPAGEIQVRRLPVVYKRVSEDKKKQEPEEMLPTVKPKKPSKKVKVTVE